MSEKAISSTTQEFLDVYDIINDTVLLKDGTASIILQVGTMNFSLLAEQEQDAIIFTYGSLLNSLNYPIQISIQSQTKDVTKYLRLLDEQVQKASSDRKATLIKQYRSFVATLIKERNVLEKHFYVTIPASPAEMGLITPSSVLPGKTTFDITTIEKSIILEKASNLLEPRRDHLISQFNRLGLYTRQLDTQEIIQNFYINYNPEAVEGQEISNNENYTTPLVRASFGGKTMQNNNQINNTATNNTTDDKKEIQSPTPQEILSNEPIADTISSDVASTNLANTNEAVFSPAAAPLQATPSQEINSPVTQVDSSQLTASQPISPQVETPQPVAPQPVVPQPNGGPIGANSEVNLSLNLDPNLINNDQLNQMPVVDDLKTSDQANIENTTIYTEKPIINNIKIADEMKPEPVNSISTPTTPDLMTPDLANPDSTTSVSTSISSTPVAENLAPTQEPILEQNQTPSTNQDQNNFAEEITPLQSKLEQPVIEKPVQPQT